MFGAPVFNDVPVSLQILLKPFADHPELQLWRVGLVYSVDTTTNALFGNWFRGENSLEDTALRGHNKNCVEGGLCCRWEGRSPHG